MTKLNLRAHAPHIKMDPGPFLMCTFVEESLNEKYIWKIYAAMRHFFYQQEIEKFPSSKSVISFTLQIQSSI